MSEVAEPSTAYRCIVVVLKIKHTRTYKTLLTLLFAIKLNEKIEANFLAVSSLDNEMVDILTSLAEESSQPGSQKTILSQSILLDQGNILNRS